MINFTRHGVGSQAGGSGAGHGGSGGRGGGNNKVGVAYDKLYEPTGYGTSGGFGAGLGNSVCICIRACMRA